MAVFFYLYRQSFKQESIIMLMRRVHQLLLDVQVGRFSFVVVTLSITNNFRSADITKMSTKKEAALFIETKK